jgi:predicted RNase H-like HicB family nuclease
MVYRLPLQLTRDEGIWLGRCPQVQGFLVTGETIDQVLAEVPVVAQALYEACREKGWSFVTDHPDAALENIVWVLELPQLAEAAA